MAWNISEHLHIFTFREVIISDTRTPSAPCVWNDFPVAHIAGKDLHSREVMQRPLSWHRCIILVHIVSSMRRGFDFQDCGNALIRHWKNKVDLIVSAYSAPNHWMSFRTTNSEWMRYPECRMANTQCRKIWFPEVAEIISFTGAKQSPSRCFSWAML